MPGECGLALVQHFDHPPPLCVPSGPGVAARAILGSRGRVGTVLVFVHSMKVPDQRTAAAPRRAMKPEFKPSRAPTGLAPVPLPAAERSALPNLVLRAMRPRQWTKNLLCASALV